MAARTSFLLLALFFGVMSGKIVQLRPCGDSNVCELHEVRVDPCTTKTCIIRKGNPASISFDYTPKFSANKLKNMASVIVSGAQSNFPDMVEDACLFTKCPVVAGERQTYSYNLNISKKFPSGLYDVTWNMWNEDDGKQACCFQQLIRLR